MAKIKEHELDQGERRIDNITLAIRISELEAALKTMERDMERLTILLQDLTLKLSQLVDTQIKYKGFIAGIIFVVGGLFSLIAFASKYLFK